MPYAHHSSVWESGAFASYVVNAGLNPFISWLSRGSSYYLLLLPTYIIYLAFASLGVQYEFLSGAILKIPSLIGDVAIFYALYEITALVTKDGKKAKLVAALFFLNPFVIYESAIIGTYDNLVAAFLLLGFMFLLKGSIVKSAVSLSVAMFFRQFTLLLLPVFLFLIWRTDKRMFSRFFAAFVLSSLVLAIPYISALTSVYSLGPDVFSSYVGRFFQTTTGQDPSLFKSTDYETNIFPFLLELGIYSDVSVIYENALLFFYGAISIFMFYKLGKTPQSSFKNLTFLGHSLNLYTLVIFSLVLGFSTANLRFPQVIWIVPFLFLEVTAFRGVPNYYPYVISGIALLVHGIIKPHYLEWFDVTFPISRPPGWEPSFFGLLPTLSYPLVFSLSLFFFLYLMLVIAFSVRSMRASSSNQIATENSSTTDTSVNPSLPKSNALILFLVTYSSLEILRYAYGLNGYVTVFLLTLALNLLLSLAIFYFRNKDALLKTKFAFTSNISRVVGFFPLTLSLTFLLIVTWDATVSSFLLVQLLICSGLLLLNRVFPTGVFFLQVSFMFTIVYGGLVLLATRNTLIGLSLTSYIVAWSIFQLKISVKT